MEKKKQIGGTKPHLLKIGGINSLSTIDYPNEVSYIIFFVGCQLACPYCHNTELKWNRTINHQSILFDLKQRKGLITAVVFSGGEALLQPQNSLIELAKDIKALGMKVGLHTNGYEFVKLSYVLPHLDWVGLDIKTAMDDRYDKLVGKIDAGVRAMKSLKLILKSGIDYQLRLTHDTLNVSLTDIILAQKQVAELGAKEIVIQTCR